MHKPKPKNQTETVEEFLRRGGKIQELPAVEREPERQTILPAKGNVPLGHGCFWVFQLPGKS